VGPEILKGGGAWFFGARGAGRGARGAGREVGQLAVTPTKKYWVDFGRGWGDVGSGLACNLI